MLDEEAWKTAAVVPLPYEWAPGDNVPPPVETECLVTYDAKNLYVAFRAHDPKPSDIRAHLMDRDDTDTLIQDDHVGVMIDTFNDERRAFQFRVNPLGVQADAVFSEQDGVEDFSWDMIWNAVGRITADGYVIEMAFPLKQLRFQPGKARRRGASRRSGPGRGTCGTASRHSRATATRDAFCARRTRSRGSRASPRGATSNWTRRPRSAAPMSSPRPTPAASQAAILTRNSGSRDGGASPPA